MTAIECNEEVATTKPPTDWGGMDDEQFANELMVKMRAKGPMLSAEDMDAIERKWEEGRRVRRCAFVLMTKPFSWLQENVEADRKFAVGVAEVFSCTAGIDYYRGVADLMEQANIWAMSALVVREDMNEIIAEANSEPSNVVPLRPAQ